MTAVIEASGVAKRYGGLLAVDDLSFAADEGEILGVLGPNGAGKTTAIRILTTILTPTTGTFSVAGVPHTRAAEIRQRIGALPESAGYPELQSGEEYVRYFARLYGRSRGDARATARALLEEVGLSDRRRSLIASYSRGMRQRLGIARALVNDPRVLFLDEPTLGLDPAGQREVLALIRRLARERDVTVLLCTHLLVEVEEICTRVLILNRGRVVAHGTVAEVSRRAAAPRSARLQVAHDRLGDALRLLGSVAGIERAEAAEGRPGSLTLTLAARNGRSGEDALADGVRALLAEDILPLSFELEGARLSDAFLAMTGAR
jgi:ABC-2 type transport system ATP-binding protein